MAVKQLTNNTLPVVTALIDNYPVPQNLTRPVHLLVVLHVLDDTEQFIRTVSRLAFRSLTVIGVPYSSKESVIQRLIRDGYRVLAPSDDDILETIESELCSLFELCVASDEKLLILEIGGRCARPLVTMSREAKKYCLGVVEDTTYGRRVYQSIGANLPVPVFHVASSRLKNLEALFVGEAVAEEVQAALKRMGRRITAVRVGVLGYGPVGESVANSIRRRLGIVSVYDVDPVQLVRAAMAGFNVDERLKMLRTADLIIGASGHRSLQEGDIDVLPHGSVLCSASSGRVELPMAALDEVSINKRAIAELIHGYKMRDGRELFVLGDGYPVNFRTGSVPDEVIDLIYSEIYLCIRHILTEPVKPGLFAVTREMESMVASTWANLEGIQ